ncbi:4Fe-4S binding protein [Consotaella aegiceratis]|uniref:4Fe-4S binding protein n=1 Tax=Consotaella aegiceratis TaxID=3097961 RepID=UPI002F3FF40E
MAMTIVVESCTVCGACEFECPNGAIKMKKGIYAVDPAKCTECEGQFDDPQCAEVCPSPGTCVPA